jgi:lipopolysaccharide transport system ATP-binding protein
LAFAVAAHLEPEILIVDEVLAVGDVAFQKKCLRKMGAVSEEGRTVLFVSHNMGAIRNLSQRCMLLKEGSMYLLGDTPSVINEYLRDGLFDEDSVRDFDEKTGSTVYVKRVALFDEKGLPSRRFHLGSQILVQVDYVVRDDVRQSMILLAIAKDGMHIFQSHDTDLQPGLLEMRRAGEYSARVFLPRILLTAGLYSLWVGAAVGAQGQYGHDGHPDALSFEIDEEGEDTYFKSYAKSRGMLVIANLEWQAEKKK